MRSLTLLALAATTASSLSISVPWRQSAPLQQQPITDSDAEKFLIEVSPGETRWVTEDEKWALRREGLNFMDITETQSTYPAVSIAQSAQPSVKFPKKTAYNDAVKSLSKSLSKDEMHNHLTTFTSFHTRYYKSSSGIDSATWLIGQVNDTIVSSGADKYGASVKMFPHSWGQFSVIATIPGKSNKTVVIGAHQDSINLFLPSILAAPGADDDGSGSVTILEALRVLLQSEDIIKGKAPNTIEFHWYSAEEGGLLGSQAIFQSYSTECRDIRAMLQQDMTGYTQKTLDAGEPESVGVIVDFVNPKLTDFIKEVVVDYCDIPYVETKCGYACSDHASASKYGYPSAFVIESDFKYSDSKIHTTEDKIEYLDFNHMLQHAKLTLGFAYELAFADL
ncbi:putative leucyl aminopeptidase [Phaeomoniella chlamydospora]|uniref:Peptide hydrolase n=1 Tax=Phaeomoniella chlamydospora TaxID=158046 RepID=A0A0G2EVM1_PHACM|nr:putative leucyl aminopeptidase [Phaeomoniella chlamydospora]